MFATELFEFVSGYQCAIHQHHARTDHFSQRIVGRANDADLVYSGVRAEDVFRRKRLLRLAGYAVIPIITLALFTANSPTAS
jgi:hypothetical protein